jgi:glycosyltransferase involved in cell wall biosynthesis
VAARALRIPNLEFIEKVPYHEIQGHYDEARVFVNTSTYEGFPNSFIQSGLGKTALLSMRVDPDGMVGIFRSGILAGDSVEGLIQGARTMLADPEALLRMQEANERMISEWLDNDANVTTFLKGLQ